MLVMLEIMDTLGANTNIVLDDTAEPSEERTAGDIRTQVAGWKAWAHYVRSASACCWWCRIQHVVVLCLWVK
jgi:hypothetical protein